MLAFWGDRGFGASFSLAGLDRQTILAFLGGLWFWGKFLLRWVGSVDYAHNRVKN